MTRVARTRHAVINPCHSRRSWVARHSGVEHRARDGLRRAAQRVLGCGAGAAARALYMRWQHRSSRRERAAALHRACVGRCRSGAGGARHASVVVGKRAKVGDMAAVAQEHSRARAVRDRLGQGGRGRLRVARRRRCASEQAVPICAGLPSCRRRLVPSPSCRRGCRQRLALLRPALARVQIWRSIVIFSLSF